MTTQEHQSSEDPAPEKPSELIYTIEEESLVVAQTVEKDVKPYERLFIKCKDDWIHHLAQALAFSLMVALVPIATLEVSIFDVILRNLHPREQHILTAGLRSILPQPLSAPVSQILGQAFDTFSRASGLSVFFSLLFAIVFGSFLFSLMEACLDVVYHLPPRPFFRRHLVAIIMLLVFAVLIPIIVLASAAPTFILSLLHFVPPGDIPESNVIFRIASIAGSLIISLILFQAIYVLVPHRSVRLQELGLHIRHSWRGALVSTVVLQLGLQLFPLYVTSFGNNYIGQIGFALIALVFFYLITLILLLGAEVNAFFAEGIRVPQSDLITQASKGGFQ